MLSFPTLLKDQSGKPYLSLDSTPKAYLQLSTYTTPYRRILKAILKDKDSQTETVEVTAWQDFQGNMHSEQLDV